MVLDAELPVTVLNAELPVMFLDSRKASDVPGLRSCQ